MVRFELSYMSCCEVLVLFERNDSLSFGFQPSPELSLLPTRENVSSYPTEINSLLLLIYILVLFSRIKKFSICPQF